MARGIQNHGGGSYDASAQQDIADADAFESIITLLSGTADAINPHVSGNYVVTTGSADAMTLGAPTAGVDDNLSIAIWSNTAFAHTLTATGLLQTGQSGKTGVLTFAAFAGSGVSLRAYGGKWQVLGGQSLTYTS
jgi:hypothetical protein